MLNGHSLEPPHLQSHARSGHDHPSLDTEAASPDPLSSLHSILGIGEKMHFQAPPRCIPQELTVDPRTSQTRPFPCSPHLVLHIRLRCSSAVGCASALPWPPGLLHISSHGTPFPLLWGAPACSPGVPLPGRRLTPLVPLTLARTPTACGFGIGTHLLVSPHGRLPCRAIVGLG